MTALKVPPHSIELEQAVLGAILIDMEAIDHVADLLVPNDFYRLEHQEIYKVCLDLFTTNEKTDAMAVMEKLVSHGASDSQACVYGLVEQMRGSANLKYYARQLKDKATERQILMQSHRVGDIAYQDIPTAEKIQFAQQAMMEIGSAQDKNSLVDVNVVMQEAIDEIDYRCGLGSGLVGIPTGFKDLDEKLGGWEAGTMIIIAGRPSMGKSTIAMNTIENAIMQDKYVVNFNLEMPRKSLMIRTYASMGDIFHDQLRKGKLNDEDWPKLNSVVAKLKDRPLMIDDTPGLTTSQMRARLRRASRKRPIDLIVVDYLQIMGDSVNGNDTSRITHISRQLKSLGKEFNAPIIVLSQLSRKVEERQNKRPIMSDLRESGAIEQDADVILFMYRDEYYNENSQFEGMAECIIGKQRNGPTGSIYLKSELAKMRFKDFEGQVPRYEAKQKPFASINGGRS